MTSVFKKLLLIIILLFPVIAKADELSYTIKAKVDVDGINLEGGEFTFDLIDSDNNVIQNATNDKDGNIIFENIPYQLSDVKYSGGTFPGYAKEKKYGYSFYMIKQTDSKLKGASLDEDIIYVGAYYFEDGTYEIDYIKNIEDMKKELNISKKTGKSIFHATEEDLRGQAYAVFENATNTLTFFRDEEGKYTNGQIIDGNYYYTNFEGDELNAPWRYLFIKKIIFRDPIKPKIISNGRYSWFSELYNITEYENIDLLDTSEITTFKYLFFYNKNITSLDLSRWDTSKVTDMSYMFNYCEKLSEVYLDNFDTSNVVNMSSMFSNAFSLEWFDTSLFETNKLNTAELMFENNKTIKYLDFSNWTIKSTYGAAGIVARNDALKYVDVSNFPGLASEAIGVSKCLSIVKFAKQYSPFSTNIGPYNSCWYSLSSQKFYVRNDIKDYYDGYKDLENYNGGYVIRPDCNTEIQVFHNKYNEDKKEEPMIVSVPNTKAISILLITVGLLIIIISFIIVKKMI